MRARVVAHGVLAFAVAASLVACIDLFHGTDFESACDVDAAACEAVDANMIDVAIPPVQDAGSDGPTDFCLWNGATAAVNAAHACTWLGACEGAFGDNAFGPCMVHAVLAYDCNANPNRPLVVGSAAHAYWDCLARTTSCTDVDRCLQPTGKHAICADDDAGYIACDPEEGALVACAANLANGSAPTGLESCVALGQTCSATGAAACGGTGTCTAANAGTVTCDPSTKALRDCDPDGGSIDYGIDCTSTGSGKCGTSGTACGAIADSGCLVTTDVLCTNDGHATGCPSGAPEDVNCNAVLGQPSGTSSTCDPNAPGRAWDVSRACSVGPSCAQSGDSCSGTVLSTCTRGAPLVYDCKSQGFTSCATVTYPGDSAPHAHCANDAGTN